MIDEKKIEEAAIKHISSNEYSSYNSGEIEDEMILFKAKDSFKAGINWFLDNLWHPASEEPKSRNKDNEYVVCLVWFKDGYICLYNYDDWHHWWCSDEDNQKFLNMIDKWLYIDDLMKGGK